MYTIASMFELKKKVMICSKKHFNFCNPSFFFSFEQLQKFKKEVYGNHAKVDEETDDLKKIKKVAVSVGLSFTISACLAASFIPSMLSSITHHGRQARTAHSTQRQVFIRTRDNKIYISQTVLNDFALDALNKVNQ